MEKIYTSATKPSSWMKLMPELCTEDYDMYYDPFTCGYVRYDFLKPKEEKRRHYTKTKHNGCLSGESDKDIMTALTALGAFSMETSVDVNKIVAKGIELGLTTADAIYGKNNHHRWSPRISVMMGVSTNDEVIAAREEPSLHRKMMKTDGGMNYHYWIDETKDHREDVAESC